MKKLAIIGVKEFAQQIRSFAKKTGEFEFVGYLDNIEPVGNIVEGFPVLGKVADGITLYEKGVLDCVFIAVGYTRFDLRESFYNELKGKIPFANIIEPSVVFENNIQLGEGIYIGGKSFIGSSTRIGDNVFIHGGTCIGHDNIIGSHSYLSGRIDTCGFCNIGKKCFMGIRVLVADHINICDNSWIGIGCIVAKNIVTPGKYMTSAAKLFQIE